MSYFLSLTAVPRTSARKPPAKISPHCIPIEPIVKSIIVDTVQSSKEDGNCNQIHFDATEYLPSGSKHIQKEYIDTAKMTSNVNSSSVYDVQNHAPPLIESYSDLIYPNSLYSQLYINSHRDYVRSDRVDQHRRDSFGNRLSPTNSIEGSLEDPVLDTLSDDEDSLKADSDSSGDSSSENSKKKRRVLFSKFQTRELEKRFAHSWYISSNERDALAKHLNMDPDQVKIWFQNHRYKVKKMFKDVRDRSGGPQLHHGRPYPLLPRESRKPPMMRDLYMHQKEQQFSDYPRDSSYLENTRSLNAEFFPSHLYKNSLPGLRGVGFPTTPYSDFTGYLTRSQYPSGRSIYSATQYNPYNSSHANHLANCMLQATHLHAYNPHIVSHVPNQLHLGVTM